MTVSETVSKKVGRPKAISDHELALVRYWFPHIKSDRGRQNQAYAQRAIKLLYFTPGVDAARYSNFLPARSDVESGEADIPMTLLSHLGRLDADLAVEAARVISDHQMPSGEAIEYVKRMTTGKTRVGSRQGLVSALQKALAQYTAKHDCDPEVVADAVNEFSEIDSETQGRGGDE